MIHVKRSGDESSQKVISMFLKRVRKSNLVARKRKTQVHPDKVTKLKRKQKAIRKADYLQKVSIMEKVGKK